MTIVPHVEAVIRILGSQQCVATEVKQGRERIAKARKQQLYAHIYAQYSVMLIVDNPDSITTYT